MIDSFSPELRSDLARRASREGAVLIFLWAYSAPRVMTMIPLAIADEITDESALVQGIEWMAIEKRDLPLLDMATIFMSSETAIGDGPQRAIRVAMSHSLPDYDLRANYPRMLPRKIHIAGQADYFGVPVRRPVEDWTVETYRPIVDGVLPERMLEHRRPTLTMLPFGYPKIDLLMTQAKADLPRDTITFAPTQTTMHFSVARAHGEQIIAMLLAQFPDHRIAFRPYPGRDVTGLAPIAAAFRDEARFHFDTSVTGHDGMMRSAVLVTDRSSVAYSYSLGLARPAIFFAPDGIAGDDPQGFERYDPGGFRAGSVPGIGRAVAHALATPDEIADRIARIRGDYIFHPGRAAATFAEIVPDILAGRTRDGWLEIPRRPFPSSDPEEVDRHLATLSPRFDSRQRDKMVETLRRDFLA